MKKRWIILIILIIIALLAIIMTPSTPTTDITNMNMPNGWDNRGDGFYVKENYATGLNEGLQVMNATNDLINDYKTNNTDDHYEVTAKSNNTYSYYDGLNSEFGYFEVIEIEGNQYFINYHYPVEILDDPNTETENVLNEVNQLNGFEPIAV